MARKDYDKLSPEWQRKVDVTAKVLGWFIYIGMAAIILAAALYGLWNWFIDSLFTAGVNDFTFVQCMIFGIITAVILDVLYT